MSEQFTNKKYIQMFFTTKICPLSYTDYLSYCYRCYQDRFNVIPTYRRIAKATGVKEETVSAATARLQKVNLLAADAAVISPCPNLDWFQQCDALLEKFGDDHFSLWFRNWRCFVRRPGFDNPLRVSDVLVYSVILNSAVKNWKPLHGWSKEYLALVTRTSPETVSKSLDRLEELGFFSVLDGMRFKLYKLRESQLKCFSDKVVHSGVASPDPDEFVDEFAPASQVLEQSEKANQEFIDWLKRWPISDKDKDRVYYTVYRHSEWPHGWQDKAVKLVGKIMEHNQC